MRFLRQGFCLPPVLRRLWRESREIPAGADGGIGKKRVSDARRAEIDGGPSSAGDAGHETRATRRGVGRRSCAVSVTYPCCIPLPDVPVRVEKGEGEDGDPHLCRARVRVFERKTRESRFPCGN